MIKQTLTATALLFSLFTWTAAQSRTDGFKDANPRQTLEGLSDIGLIVKYGQAEGLEKAAQPSLLQELRDRATARLRQKGIPFLSSAHEADLVGKPRLVFTITVKRQTDPPPALLIETKLFQRVRLWRDRSQEMELATWSMSSSGTDSESDTLFALFDKPLDAFVSAYLAANSNTPRSESVAMETPAQLRNKSNGLQGLTGIDFMVTTAFIEFVDPDLKKFSDTLQTEAENKLKQAGIPLLRYAPDTARAGYPLLNIVLTLDQNGASAASAIDVRTQFWQRVRPIRELKKYSYAATWESHANDGPTITEPSLRKIVNNQLDQFIEAYKSANPKPAAEPVVKVERSKGLTG